MKRTILGPIQNILEKKMVFLSGPRQCGKTTVAKTLLRNPDDHYLNWDDDEDRETLLRKQLPTGDGLLVLDEIHKYPHWRNLVKGIFDKRGPKLKILVTGSARLDHYRRGGDSLQGRYRLLRMHTISLAETENKSLVDLKTLLTYGGFPEPFLARSESESRVWSRQYRTRLVREELVSLEKVSEVSLVEHLVIRLPDCVGSPLSINSLREDLKISHPTVSRWITLLENIYCIFRIYPFGGPKIRAVKKEAKHYHYDWNVIQDPGPRFENLVACHLLKWCHWVEDTEGYDMELRYFKDNEKREVDFVITRDRKPIFFIECKSSEMEPTTSLKYLKSKYPTVKTLQISPQKEHDFTDHRGIRICDAAKFLKTLA